MGWFLWHIYSSVQELCTSQGHLLIDRRPSTTAYPACWAIGIEIVYGEEKKCCTGPTRAAKAGQKSLVPARRAQVTSQGRTPFLCTLWVPIHLSFNSQKGPPLSSLSGSSYILFLPFAHETSSKWFFSPGGGGGGRTLQNLAKFQAKNLSEKVYCPMFRTPNLLVFCIHGEFTVLLVTHSYGISNDTRLWRQ